MLEYKEFIFRAAAAVLAAAVLAACGSTGLSGSNQASPTPSDPRLVVADLTHPPAGAAKVRLMKLDGTVTTSITGEYDGNVGGEVIVLNGTTLEALNRDGKVTRLGQLAAMPDLTNPGSVAVNPQLTQWIYAIRDEASTARIHLGTPATDKIVATLPSPNGNAFYRPFAWNASGVYMVRQPVGIGGAGPFLEYDFPLAKFDLATDRVTDVSPQCIVHQVLDDGTMICGQPNVGGRIEVRSPSGHSNVIQVGTGGNTNENFVSVAVSPDGKRLIAGRNGSKDPAINYQMAGADLTSSSAQAFGPLDYLPDAWLPDGRVVADHRCTYADQVGSSCDATLDGTYIFSANGSMHTLFYKLAAGDHVVGYV
jgi:hypothetical protein